MVSSCSYEARRFGVRSAMPTAMALKLCPQAKVIKGDMERYSQLTRLDIEVIQEKAPIVEKASIDEFYLDISGMDRFYSCYQWTNELANRIQKKRVCPLVLLYPLIKRFPKSELEKENPKDI